MSDNFLIFALLVVLWTLPWKAWGLWLAARRNERWWFFAMLILNTLAILEIMYIFFVAKQQDERRDHESIASDPEDGDRTS